MDIERINDCLSNPANTHQLTEFFHSCINEISSYTPPSFQQFVNIGWTEDEYKFMYKLTTAVLKNPKICSLDQEKISQELTEYQINIPEELIKCVKIRLDHLTDILMTQCSQRYMPIMTDFDWRVKMIMGSSSVALIRQPLLQLDLKISETNLERIEKIEMNEEEIDNLIKVLESIK